MTEMTNEPEIETTASAAEVQEPNQNSESSPETHAEDKPQVSENAQKRINELTAEKYALKKKLEELETAPKTEKAEVAPVVNNEPSLPEDLYDEDAMRKYHADMLAYNRNLAKEAAESTYQQQQNTAQQRKAEEERQSLIRSFAEQGLKDGLTIEKMQMNEQILNGSGINGEVGAFIMNDANGAKLADYLANDAETLHKINAMSPMQAAVFIANEVKLKALAPSNVSKAPEPTDTFVSGSGVASQDDFDSLCPGAQFD